MIAEAVKLRGETIANGIIKISPKIANNTRAKKIKTSKKLPPPPPKNEKNETTARIAKRRGDKRIKAGKKSNESHDAYGKTAKIKQT